MKVWLHIFYVCLNRALHDPFYSKLAQSGDDQLISIYLHGTFPSFSTLSPAPQKTPQSRENQHSRSLSLHSTYRYFKVAFEWQ